MFHFLFLSIKMYKYTNKRLFIHNEKRKQNRCSRFLDISNGKFKENVVYGLLFFAMRYPTIK